MAGVTSGKPFSSLSTRLGSAWRFGGYAFWHSAGVILPLGLDRLVVCPLLNRHLGEEIFGSFIWVMGVMNLFGSIGAAGFVILLMRSLAQQTQDGARTMVRTALLMSGASTGLIVLLASAGSLAIADSIVRTHAVALYVPLGCYALARSIQVVVAAELRIDRRFVILFVVKLIEGLVLLAILPFFPDVSLWLVGFLYVLSVSLSLVPGVAKSRQISARGTWWDWQTARWLMRGWYAGAAFAVVDQTQWYAARVVVGAVSGGAEVARFYAGVSISNLFAVPVGMLGFLVLSLLAGHTQFALTGRRGHLYLLLVAVVAVAVGLLSYAAGIPLVRGLYPDHASVTVEFYHWLALANGAMSVRTLMRPVTIKYARMSRVALLSAATVAMQLGLLAALVPLFQARGGAIGLALSSVLAAICWFAYFEGLRRRAKRGDMTSVDIPGGEDASG